MTGSSKGPRNTAYSLSDSVAILHHLTIPKAKHAIAVGFEEPGPDLVVAHDLVEAVLVTIELDNQLCGRAEEIDYVRTDRLLAAETKGRQLPAS
jgi:hypothetical protein